MALPYYDALELTEVLKYVGFTGDNLRKAYANAMKESWGTPSIVNTTNPNGTKDWGLFQINDVWEKYFSAEEWAQRLDPYMNARMAYEITKGGSDWGMWGIGETGYAAALKKSDPDMWALLQKYWQQHYDAYPERLAAAKAKRTPTTVRQAYVKPGKTNSDVKVYQYALRGWLANKGVDPLALNPSGATGTFGAETSVLTREAYKVLVQLTGNQAWLASGDVPGPSLLKRLGLNPV